MGVLTLTSIFFFLTNHAAIDLDPFDRTRNVSLVGANPVADDACSQHVGNKLIAFSVPDKQCRARATAAVDLEKVLLLVARNLDFVLQNTGRPKHAHDVGFFGVAQADHDVGGILAEISVRSIDFKLLAVAAGEDFHFRADGRLVVVQSFEREPQPVILIAAQVAQQDGWPVVLRDEQVGGAVAVVVAGDDGARIFELNLVEANVGGDIFESIGAEIAEQTHFAFAFFSFADGDEIDPAVIVVVDGGDAKGADPVRLWKCGLARTTCPVYFATISKRARTSD